MSPKLFDECDRHIRREASYWVRRIGRPDVAAWDDLYQEGWLVAVQVVGRYDPTKGAAVGTYLTTCLRNKFRDLAARAQRPIYQSMQNDDSVPPEAEWSARLSMLTPEQQTVAASLIRAGGSVVKAARVLGVQREHVKAVMAEMEKSL